MAQRWTGGHTGPVLCIGAAAGPDGVLASGAEGGEVSVWTQEGTLVSQLSLESREDVTCAVFSPTSPGLLYASHGETVSVFDPRSLKAPLKELKDVGEDEINSLSVNETGASLALADDSGAVRVVDLQTDKVSRTLRKHTNICSSVAFRPQRPQSLVSAGLDMQVMMWNLQKARPVWTFGLQEALEEEQDAQSKPGQLFNPPLAHCVGVASCGNVLACAAEDGRVHLARVGTGSRLQQHSAFKAHSQGVSQAHFLGFMPHPYWLVTGGNDGVVALWDVAREPGAAGEPDVREKRQRRRSRHKNGQSTRDDGKKSEEELQDGTEHRSGTEPGPKLKFNHQEKVNWVCPAVLRGKPSLLVADQSSGLSVYSLDE